MARTCWAVSRGDCDGKLSLEHPITEKLWSGQMVHIAEGHAREIFKQDKVSRTNLKAKILCARHNAQLSPLDTEVIKLHDALRARRESPDPEEMRVCLDAQKLERWLMKAHYGICAAGWVYPNATPEVRPQFHAIPLVVDIIFGDKPLAGGTGGMYLIMRPGNLLPSDGRGDQFAWCTLSRPRAGGGVSQVGLVVVLSSVGLVLSADQVDVAGALRVGNFNPAPSHRVDWSDVEVVQRPTGFTQQVMSPGWARPGRLVFELDWSNR